MKILLGTHAFAPSIGGIETCSLDLALAFSKLGHDVQVLTQTPSGNPDEDCGLKVIRRPATPALLKAISWCDIFFQNNISLQTAWPLMFIRKPWVVSTQTWLHKSDGSANLLGHLKKLALRFATNIYISRAVRDRAGAQGTVVPNPYDDTTFRLITGICRERSVVFLGRLVKDKGCDILIQSLAELKNSGLVVPLTIIGKGPDEAPLRSLVEAERLSGQVRFAGALKGENLARELNRHKVLVVPSRWDEPFGIVALEGIACGCLVVGATGGGLPDAIGPCGVTFKTGDHIHLAQMIEGLINQQMVSEQHQEALSKHLDSHRVEFIAARYVEIFEQVYSSEAYAKNGL
jgi:glycosyltransferase involved in cell wall biosynthesis